MVMVMDVEFDPEIWRRVVGERVVERREQLYRSRRAAATAAGIAEAAFRSFETGTRQVAAGVSVSVNPTRRVRLAVCTALGWTPDSIDRLVRGEEPELVSAGPAGSPVAYKLEDRVKSLSEDEKALVEAYLDGLNARSRSAAGERKADRR